MEWRPVASPRDWALGLCIGNFAEHALRRRGNFAWLGAAGSHDFLCWFSPLASPTWHGTLPSPLLPGCPNSRATSLRATQHDQRRILRDSRRPWSRLRDSHYRALSPGALGRRGASSSNRNIDSKTWTRGFLRRTHHSCRFSCPGPKWLDGLLGIGRANCHRHFRRRTVYVFDFVFVCSGTTGGNSSCLAFRRRKEVCELDRAKAHADADFLKCCFVSPDGDRLFTHSRASFRGQRTFAAT